MNTSMYQCITKLWAGVLTKGIRRGCIDGLSTSIVGDLHNVVHHPLGGQN